LKQDRRVAERRAKSKKTSPKRAAAKPVVVAAHKAENTTTAVPTVAPVDFTPAFCIVGESDIQLFGKRNTDRYREQFRRAGLTKEVSLADLSQHLGPAILVNAQGVLDQPLIAAIIKRPNLAIVSEKESGGRLMAAHVRASDAAAAMTAMKEGQPFSRPGILMRAPSEIDANFWQALRKRETPYALPVDDANKADVEWRMFMGTYKGATDIITKHLWPVPAFHATRWLAPRGVTPNMVTTVGAVMTVLAFILFWQGQYALGLIAAWLMTFLDTVDGKLARTTLTSSKWGDVFDHGIDLVHPPFWYFAWAYGLINWGIAWSSQLFWGALIVILGGYVLQRLMEGISIKWLGLEIHIWRKIDTYFRQITARRNPNLILLTIATVFGRPDLGLLAVAAWTGICLLLHGVQLLQAFAAKPADAPLTSWMTKP
jgi:phosphatidylglycerophosphate synthase